MDDVFLLAKLRIVRAIAEVPKDVRQIVERVNALRNALAHSFFPENRRQYAGKKKVVYRGLDIFTELGIQRFEEDCKAAFDYLMNRAFGS